MPQTGGVTDRRAAASQNNSGLLLLARTLLARDSTHLTRWCHERDTPVGGIADRRAAAAPRGEEAQSGELRLWLHVRRPGQT